MEKSEFRVVIKHYFLKGKTQKETKEKLDKHYGKSAPSAFMVKYWFAEFKRGRTSTKDEQRPGRPIEATTPEITKKIHDMILNDPKIKLRELAEASGISQGSVFNILHEQLKARKLCARWVPRFLTIDQKRIRLNTSEQNLAYFKRNPKEFLRRFITMDETWVHYYTPESREASKEWVLPGGSAPKRPKTQQTAGKVMASIFWDSNGIILIDFLEKGRTITGAYYAALLDQLKEEVERKRPHMKKKKILFHDDNAPAHTSLIAQAKKHELGFEILPHPPYSPDLAPSDYYLFPNFKRWLCGKRFCSNSEVKSATEGYFKGLDSSYFKKGIQKLEDRWYRCTELKGDYVEE